MSGKKKIPSTPAVSYTAAVLVCLCVGILAAAFAPLIAQGTNPSAETAADYEIMPRKGPSVSIEEREGVTYITIEGHEIILCNKQYPVPEDFGDGLDSECERAADCMIAAAEADDIYIYIGSGYRSYFTQQEIFERHISSYGIEETINVTARPGHSEHQTGLAIDLGGNNASTYLREDFDTTKEFRWLDEHAAEYGFILRYPRGKEALTGYIYEPWHYRYVGKELALIIAKSGLCLEEYAAFAKQ